MSVASVLHAAKVMTSAEIIPILGLEEPSKTKIQNDGRTTTVEFINAIRRKTAVRERQVHEDTYGEAIARGESPEQATTAAEGAVQQRRRRRRRIIFGSVG